MTNKEIANHFRELAQLMKLADENPFKIRSYQNAYRNLRSQPNALSEMTDDELSSIDGVGKAIRSKIRELLESGRMSTLESYREQIPEGIREMLEIKGIGPKKIRTVWKELGVESIGELLYACNENRLIRLKGFGKKTQQKIAEALQFYNASKNRFLYAELEEIAVELLAELRTIDAVRRAEWTGSLRRRAITLSRLHCILLVEKDSLSDIMNLFEKVQETDEVLEGLYRERYPVHIDLVGEVEKFPLRWLATTGSPEFLEETGVGQFDEDRQPDTTERELVERKLGFYVPPEMREKDAHYTLCEESDAPLINEEDIRGVVHAHTTASDGLHTLEQMAAAAQSAGYEYLTITDHSRSAFYAGGLTIEELIEQGRSIDRFNEEMEDFRLLKGIETDILSDGTLDYPEEILDTLDVIIASVHSQLSMDRGKATRRLIEAIEHPATDILGHVTGRLLLSRRGYPVDHQKVIDACAANRVAIEINANPRRLDIDWKWIHRAVDRGVPLSINPDAHSAEGIGDIHFGVLAARKGGLTASDCLNTRTVDQFFQWLKTN